MKSIVDCLLNGAIDMHCHGYPETTLETLSRQDDEEIIQSASEAGMRGVVLKSHLWPTTGRVYYHKKKLPEGFSLFSSITLNHIVGGISPFVVESAIAQGAKVLWMPTWGARNDIDRGGFFRKIKQQFKTIEEWPLEGIFILKSNGEVIPEVEAILEIAKEARVVVVTGHLSPSESLAMIRLSHKMSYDKIIFGHPDSPSVNATLDDMKKAASLGAYIEFCFLGTMPLIQRKHPSDTVKLIKAIGVDHCIISTDAFYSWIPPASEMMRMNIACFLDLGISENEIRTMITDNPKRLLGL